MGSFRSDCSPEQIAGRLRLHYPEDAGMRISERASAAGSLQPHSLTIPVAVLCAAPTGTAGDKAGTAGAEAGCPGVSI